MAKKKTDKDRILSGATKALLQGEANVQRAKAEGTLFEQSDSKNAAPAPTSAPDDWKKSREAFIATFCSGPKDYSDITNKRPKDTRLTLFISAEQRDRLAAMAWYREQHPEQFPTTGRRHKPSINSLFDEVVSQLTNTPEADQALHEYQKSSKYHDEMTRVRLHDFLDSSDEDKRLYWFFLNNHDPATEFADIRQRQKNQGEASDYHRLLVVIRNIYNDKGELVHQVQTGKYVLAGNNRVYDLLNKKYMRLIK